ncbi:sensor histidine kinase [Paenibacillus aquistagni]|uniref:sensor histidine kinase n=1 Tax=Paenibacillus aquistagni TaxID=1852522 RepID=UPI000B514949|nr:histidine kinase [Paenibacillus aquistagni]
MKKWSMTIQQRITITVGACFILLLVSISAYLIRETAAKTVPFNRNLTQQIVDARAGEISSWLQQRKGELDALAYLIIHEQMSLEETLSMLDRYRYHKDSIYESFGIIDDKGRLHSTSGHIFSVTHRPYYQRMVQDERPFVVSNFICSGSNQEEIVVMLYPLQSAADDPFMKYLSAAVPISQLQQMANAIQLYDGKGQLLDGLQDGFFMDGELGLDKEYQDRELFTASIQDTADWVLSLDVERTQLYVGMTSMLKSIAIISMVVGSVLIVMLMVLSSSIVKPIQWLKQDMIKAGEGDRMIRSTLDTRGDEIGTLGQSFNDMLTKLYSTEQEKRSMELRLLHEQLKPHFIYNTLDTIQWTAADYGADEVVELVEALAAYLRLGLGDGDDFVPLHQELLHVENYLIIQRVRYRQIADVRIEYEDELLEERVPRFTLQPLVENAIYHGIKRAGGKLCEIAIWIERTESEVLIYVGNNGHPLEPGRMNALNEALRSSHRREAGIGFGLYNVNRRIQIAYGKSYGLQLQVEQGWTSSIVRIPFSGGEMIPDE